jgi:hypothetical protein
LKNVVDNAGIDSAKPVGWRFIVPDGAGKSAAAHVHEQFDKKPPRMTSLSRGPELAEAIRIGENLHQLPHGQDKHYEARILRAPGACIEAYWLKPDSGGGWLVPFITSNPDLKVNQVYSADEFLAKIKVVAERRLRFEASLESKR